LVVGRSVLHKNAKAKVKKKFPQVPTPLGSNMLSPTLKINICISIFSPSPEVYKKISHFPVGQKLSEEIQAVLDQGLYSEGRLI
jgi:hypothetical protein